MKVAFDTKLKQIDGTQLDGTVKELAVNALLGVFPDEQNLAGTEKAKRFTLALKIQEGADEITPEEATLVKDLVGKAYPPLFVGQAYAVLNG